MQEEKIMNLSDDEFHEFALSKIEMFPGLFSILTYDEIMIEFYRYHKRKISNEISI